MANKDNSSKQKTVKIDLGNTIKRPSNNLKPISNNDKKK